MNWEHYYGQTDLTKLYRRVNKTVISRFLGTLTTVAMNSTGWKQKEAYRRIDHLEQMLEA